MVLLIIVLSFSLQENTGDERKFLGIRQGPLRSFPSSAAAEKNFTGCLESPIDNKLIGRVAPSLSGTADLKDKRA